MSGLALAWMAEAGLMTYRIVNAGRPSEAGGGRVPWPADYVATFVVFGGLSLVAEIGGGWDQVAAVTGWGLVLATVLNLVDPLAPFAKRQQQTQETLAASRRQAPRTNPLTQALGGN